MGRHMIVSVARVMLLGCALSRGAAAGPGLESDSGGPLLHSNQHYEVPLGPDALGLPESSLPWVAAAGSQPGTHDLLVRGSRSLYVAPGETMLEPARFRFDGAVTMSAPPRVPGLPPARPLCTSSM